MLERLADQGAEDGWRGLLVGDMSQPRGGPMLTGHASHQVGLDADIWLTPMPDRELTPAGARGDVGHHGGRRRPQGCRSEDLDAGARGGDQGRRAGSAGRAHLRQPRHQEGAVPRRRQTTARGCSKVRPYWGHDYHFHIRIACPGRQPRLQPQPPRAAGDGCTARNSITGSPMRSCIPAPHRLQPRRSRRCGWLICRPPAGRYCSRRRASVSRLSSSAKADDPVSDGPEL